MSDLITKQHLFSTLHPRLLDFLLEYAAQYHYLVSGGEWQRGAAQVQWNAAHGVGSAASLHPDRLAWDVLLRDMDGTPVSHVDTYAPAGAFWKGLHPLCRWGGDFKRADGTPKPDPYHFSIEFGGRK